MSTVSVIVPTRNRVTLLITTLCSVLWQRDVDLEVIVVDEASTDRTSEMVASLSDPRVVIVHHSVARGLSAARNRGASLAHGDWIAYVDDDDVWAPEKLTCQILAAEEMGRDWVYAGTVNIGLGQEILSASAAPSPDDVVAALPHYNPIPGGGSNVILRRCLLEEVGGFDERFTACEDWEMWARLVRTALPASVAQPLVGYRLHSGNMSLDAEKIRRNAQLIERLHNTTADWGRLHRWFAESYLRMGSHTEALGHFAKAAARGQALGVASDLAAIIRRRFLRPSDRIESARLVSDRPWMGGAAAWLCALDECVSTRTVESGRDLSAR